MTAMTLSAPARMRNGTLPADPRGTLASPGALTVPPTGDSSPLVTGCAWTPISMKKPHSKSTHSALRQELRALKRAAHAVAQAAVDAAHEKPGHAVTRAFTLAADVRSNVTVLLADRVGWR